jgi:branched-chain amino acid transport system substrate-binding protein
VGRFVFVGFIALLLVAVVAPFAGAGTNATPRSRVTAGPSPLGTPAPATGTPVKVGLIVQGGNCTGCSQTQEDPAARAAVSWLNAYHKGLGNHPVTLVTCIDSNDPGKGVDCANQMIRQQVVAVVIGSNGIIETEWKILHDAGIPVINHSVTNAALLQDPASTFILSDPNTQTVILPMAVAKQTHAKKVAIIVVDVPAATDIYNDATKRQFTRNGMTLTVVPVPLGTADMTPQAQRIVSSNPNGVVAIIGQDQFCIPALNDLHAVGFHGAITTISFCITDALRKAVPGALVKGIQFGSEAPFGDFSDPSMRQYQAVLAKYAKGADPADQPGVTVFQDFGALGIGTQGLQGAATPASVIAAMRSMKSEVLPASGGRLFRCNGKATTSGPAICSVSTITATLDASGHPGKYAVVNNQPIGN